MARYVRNSAILAKIESSYGVDPTPTGAANAMLITNLTVNPLNAQNVNRDLIRGYFGGSEQLVGTANLEVSFDVELAGAGAAGTAPAWGPLLRACAFAEVITAGSRVEYTPISTTLESATIYYYDDGALHKVLGARGTAELSLGVGERPLLKCKFTGLDGGISAAANPPLTLTAWTKPVVVTDANTGDVTLGGTYTAGSLSGGTAYSSRGLMLNLANDVKFTPLLGGETVDITQRDMSGSVMLDLTAAQEVTFMGTVKANTTTALGIQHGTTAGNIIVIYAPTVQLINPKKEDVDGRRLIGYDLRLVPSTTGNNELTVCVK
jgi:hypothetical protein